MEVLIKNLISLILSNNLLVYAQYVLTAATKIVSLSNARSSFVKICIIYIKYVSSFTKPHYLPLLENVNIPIESITTYYIYTIHYNINIYHKVQKQENKQLTQSTLTILHTKNTLKYQNIIYSTETSHGTSLTTMYGSFNNRLLRTGIQTTAGYYIMQENVAL